MTTLGILIIMPTFAGWLVAVAAVALPVLRRDRGRTDA